MYLQVNTFFTVYWVNDVILTRMCQCDFDLSVKSLISCSQNPSCLRLFWIGFCLNDNSGDVFPRQREMERLSFQWLFLPGTNSACHIKKILIALRLATPPARHVRKSVVRRSRKIISQNFKGLFLSRIQPCYMVHYITVNSGLLSINLSWHSRDLHDLM